MARLRKKHLPHHVTLTRVVGEGSEGETWSAPEPDVPAYVEQKTRLVVDRRSTSPTAGQQITSTTFVVLLGGQSGYHPAGYSATFVHTPGVSLLAVATDIPRVSTHRCGITICPVRRYFTPKEFRLSPDFLTPSAHGPRRFAQIVHRVIHRSSCGRAHALPSVKQRREARGIKPRKGSLSGVAETVVIRAGSHGILAGPMGATGPRRGHEEHNS